VRPGAVRAVPSTSEPPGHTAWLLPNGLGIALGHTACASRLTGLAIAPARPACASANRAMPSRGPRSAAVRQAASRRRARSPASPQPCRRAVCRRTPPGVGGICGQFAGGGPAGRPGPGGRPAEPSLVDATCARRTRSRPGRGRAAQRQLGAAAPAPAHRHSATRRRGLVGHHQSHGQGQSQPPRGEAVDRGDGRLAAQQRAEPAPGSRAAGHDCRVVSQPVPFRSAPALKASRRAEPTTRTSGAVASCSQPG